MKRTREKTEAASTPCAKRRKRTVQDVSDDILTFITYFIHTDDLVTYSLISKRFHKVTNRPIVWQNRCIVLSSGMYITELHIQQMDHLNVCKLLVAQEGYFALPRLVPRFAGKLRELSIISCHLLENTFADLESRSDICLPVLEKVCIFSKLCVLQSNVMEWLLRNSKNLQHVSYTVDSLAENTHHSIAGIETAILKLSKLTYLELINIKFSKSFVEQLFQKQLHTLIISDHEDIDEDVWYRIGHSPIATSLQTLSIPLHEDCESSFVPQKTTISALNHLQLHSLSICSSRLNLEFFIRSSSGTLSALDLLLNDSCKLLEFDFRHLTQLTVADIDSNTAVQLINNCANTIVVVRFDINELDGGVTRKIEPVDFLLLNSIEGEFWPVELFQHVVSGMKKRQIDKLSVEVKDPTAENLKVVQSVNWDTLNIFSGDLFLLSFLPAELVKSIRQLEVRSCDLSVLIQWIPMFNQLSRLTYLNVNIDTTSGDLSVYNVQWHYLTKSLENLRISIGPLISSPDLMVMTIFCLANESENGRIDILVEALTAVIVKLDEMEDLILKQYHSIEGGPAFDSVRKKWEQGSHFRCLQLLERAWNWEALAIIGGSDEEDDNL